MNSKDLELKLLKSIQTFEEEYKDSLNNSAVDDKTTTLLYDLGAHIKHCLDDFKDIIVEYTDKQ